LTAAAAGFAFAVNASLERMDAAIASAAVELGRTGLASPEADAVLARLAAASPYATDAVTIGADGRIAAAMPDQYRSGVGAYVGNESHNRQALAGRRAQMTPVFRAIEGFDAVSIRRPVAGANGTFLGLVSLVVDPARLLDTHADRVLANTNLTAWAIQTDGRLIYDSDPGGLVGLNMTSDPAFATYPELVALAQRMTLEPEGTGLYAFAQPGGGPARRMEAAWATAGIHGTGWRLLVAREV
jgi:hypothetical protein